MARKFMQTVLGPIPLWPKLQRRTSRRRCGKIYYRTKHTMKDSNENTFDARTSPTR